MTSHINTEAGCEDIPVPRRRPLSQKAASVPINAESTREEPPLSEGRCNALNEAENVRCMAPAGNIYHDTHFGTRFEKGLVKTEFDWPNTEAVPHPGRGGKQVASALTALAVGLAQHPDASPIVQRPDPTLEPEQGSGSNIIFEAKMMFIQVYPEGFTLSKLHELLVDRKRFTWQEKSRQDVGRTVLNKLRDQGWVYVHDEGVSPAGRRERRYVITPEVVELLDGKFIQQQDAASSPTGSRWDLASVRKAIVP